MDLLESLSPSIHLFDTTKYRSYSRSVRKFVRIFGFSSHSSTLCFEPTG